MTAVPKSCPKCGHNEVHVRVETWAVYVDGEFHLLDADEDETEPLPGAACVCADTDCLHNWRMDL